MCTAAGDLPITYTWVLRGQENIQLNSDPTSGNFTLTITQVNQYEVYICITTNNLGTDAASIDIIQASKSTIQSNCYTHSARFLPGMLKTVSVYQPELH